MDKGKARQLDWDQSVIPPRDRLEDSPLTYCQLVSGIVDFLEVAFHTILCLRSVYPYDVFARRKKYSHPCYQSRHPGLNEYISRVLSALRSEIEKSTVNKVILVIRPNVVVDPADSGTSGTSGEASTSDAYERFIFNLEYMIPSALIDPRDRDLAISSNVTSNELEAIFRGFMQKLMVVDGMLYDMPASAEGRANVGSQNGGGDGNTPTELTFAVVLELADQDGHPTGKDRHEPNTGDWIPADSENLGRHHRTHSAANGDSQPARPAPKIRPVKTLDSGVINLMLYIEEDIYAKSGLSHRPRGSSPSKAKPARPTSAQPTRVEESLLLSKATQLDLSAGTNANANATAKELKKRARRIDAERDLDQPALAEADAEPDIAQAKSKRKRARMVLGETRAAESASESSDSDAGSHSGSSQSVRGDLGENLSGGF